MATRQPRARRTASSSDEPKPEQFLAQGPLEASGATDARYIFQFSSDLVEPCASPAAVAAPAAAGPAAAAPPRSGPKFKNDVGCRKWTDTSGKTERRGVCPGATQPPDPEPGRILNIGDITLEVGPPTGSQYIKCENFRLDGIQTYGTEMYETGSFETEGPFTVFLFTGTGETSDRKRVTGVGRCLERLNPPTPGGLAVAPTPIWWRFVITVCKP